MYHFPSAKELNCISRAFFDLKVLSLRVWRCNARCSQCNTTLLVANMYLSFEVPVRFVVVELDAFGAAKAGLDLHDVILLLGRELIFAMMDMVVGTHACAIV